MHCKESTVTIDKIHKWEAVQKVCQALIPRVSRQNQEKSSKWQKTERTAGPWDNNNCQYWVLWEIMSSPPVTLLSWVISTATQRKSSQPHCSSPGCQRRPWHSHLHPLHLPGPGHRHWLLGAVHPAGLKHFSPIAALNMPTSALRIIQSFWEPRNEQFIKQAAPNTLVSKWVRLDLGLFSSKSLHLFGPEGLLHGSRHAAKATKATGCLQPQLQHRLPAGCWTANVLSYDPQGRSELLLCGWPHCTCSSTVTLRPESGTAISLRRSFPLGTGADWSRFLCYLAYWGVW